LIRREFLAHFPLFWKRPVQNPAILNPEPTMHLEFHQLDQCWEHLRVRPAAQQRRLIASLAEGGQQTPIIVVRSEGMEDRYVVIDGHKRIRALRQLGRDTVEATVWDMSAAEALMLDRTMRFSAQESALEQGWLLSEMEQQFHYSLEELARRFDRSMSWVAKRLALVELLPESTQQQIREGKIAAQTAMKYLVPMARVSAEDCERMADIWVKHYCDTRQAAQLYAVWRDGSRLVRQRILGEPELFLKTQRPSETEPPLPGVDFQRDLEMAVALLQRASRRMGAALPEMDQPQQQQTRQRIESARRELSRIAARLEQEQESKHADSGAAKRDSGDELARIEHTGDSACAEIVAAECPTRSAFEVGIGAGDPSAGESRTIPPTDPRSFEYLQRQSRASP
jgi:ParB family transcriptional regulator, chromosome partitioning protein